MMSSQRSSRAAVTMVWTRLLCSSNRSSIVGQRKRACYYIKSAKTTTRFFSSDKDDIQSSDDRISNIDPRLSEWIPPNRPLPGDKGSSHMYERQRQQQHEKRETALTEEEELKQLEEELRRLEEGGVTEQGPSMSPSERSPQKGVPQSQPPKERPTPVQQQSVDWLQTRREKLGTPPPSSTTVDGMTVSYQPPGQALPILHHTLLTADEIMEYLVSLGGIDPNLVQDKVHNQHGDSRLGGVIRGMIFVSAHSCAHVRMMAQSLVDQLKLRKLQEVGVQGAYHGPEGSDDPDETWLVIDCHNYVVHIQDEPTRRMLNLEEWWSKANPMEGVNLDDEDAMDDFVANNPVPTAYGRSGLVNWNDTINQLQNKRWTAPHKRVVERPRSNRKSRGKGTRRR